MKNSLVIGSLGLLGLLVGCSQEAEAPVTPAFSQNPAVFFNELHYDNDGTDTGEAVEIVGPAGTDLTGWSVVRYNGNGGATYASPAASNGLSGPLADAGDGYGFTTVTYPANGLQNGSPDGVALVNAAGEVVQFLSYEGTFTAANGPASGLTSTDIGVAEGSATPVGFSLQLTGTGKTYQDFTWAAASDDSFGSVNTNQTFGAGGGEPDPEPVPDVCGDDATLISEVQGSGDASPLVGKMVTVEAVVVGDFQENDGDAFNTDLDGFYVQEEADDDDTNPETSEGVFVFARNADDVSQGDLVRVTGTVTEFNGLTELTNVTVDVCGTDTATLPAPTEVTLPVPSREYLERFEGMLVTFTQNLVISEYFNFDRFGEIVLTEPPAGLDRPYTPTSYLEPGTEAVEEATDLIARSRITLDDGRSSQNPNPARHPNGEVFDLGNRFRGGDTVRNTTGVLDYRFGLYRVQPTQGAEYSRENPRTAAPEDVGGSLTVASFNVLNLFNGDGQGGGFPTSRGADDVNEYQRQLAKIVAALASIDADVFGLIEIENDPAGETSSLDDLVEALNGEVGADAYDYIETGVIGTDAIKVALVYKPATVTPVGDYAVLDTSDDQRFIDTKNRPVLIQTFDETATGGRFTVAVNHLKSKGSECGAGDDDPQQGNCNETRTQAAEALVDYLATDPTGSGDPDFLIIGDLNAYDEEDPIDEIKVGADDTPGTNDDYTDLVERFQGEFAYSYVFDGQFGYLDYALANQPLLDQVTGATEWHINADEPDILDYDTTFKQSAQDALYEPNPYRSSDHDPVVVGLELDALEQDPAVLLDELIDEVEGLEQGGTLKRGDARSLLAQLETAERHLERGREDQAAGALERFERKVEQLVRKGALSAEQGQNLIEASQEIRDLLS